MNRLITTFVLIATGSLSLGAGCTPKQVSSQSDSNPTVGRDSVVAPAVGDMPTDLIRTGDITVDGAASFAELSVAEVMMLQATTPEQIESAEHAINSGAYLGDPIRVVHVVNDDSKGLIGYDVGADLGISFETEFVVRFEEAGGDIAFEIAGEPTEPGRRMPSMFRVMISLEGPDAASGVAILLGDEGADPSDLGWADLPNLSPAEYGHRIGIRYEPGSIAVLFDGEVVLEEVARLGGGNATAAILAHPAEAVYVLSWVFDTLP